jgi:phosphoketolase
VVNVVDRMRREPDTEHPHRLPDAQFEALFTTDRPVVFAYPSYPSMIHKLTYRRTNYPNIHVRGYKEEGTTTTPFDIVMLNDLDRFHYADLRIMPMWRKDSRDDLPQIVIGMAVTREGIPCGCGAGRATQATRR